MAPPKRLMQDLCPAGLPEIVTTAHLALLSDLAKHKHLQAAKRLRRKILIGIEGMVVA